ncbi:STAS domain-containing protein [Lentzea sp. E54]|uniref:STAS domain-containing protein n=1 Tax=Lentzea xerophila TaxID=3435883 RepID=UPI003DA5206F
MSNVPLWPLHVQREVNGLSIIVRADGEVDGHTVAALRTELQTAFAMATSPYPVVVDLSAVRFFCSAGLDELVRQHRRAVAARVPLRVVAANRAVLRSITMTGLDQLLELYPDVEQALSAGRRAPTVC